MHTIRPMKKSIRFLDVKDWMLNFVCAFILNSFFQYFLKIYIVIFFLPNF